jgi:hypothetical protein
MFEFITNPKEADDFSQNMFHDGSFLLIVSSVNFLLLVE